MGTTLVHPDVMVAGPQATHPGSEGPSLVQLLLILRRRWLLLALVCTAVVAIVAIYTFTTTPLYRPMATLEIRPETPQVAPSEFSDPAFLASRNMWHNYYQTQESIFRSPTLLESVMKALPDVAAEYRGKPDPVKTFAGRLYIEKVRSSFILKVGFVDPDPEKATRVVNMIVSSYLEDANKRLREIREGTVEVISKEALPSIRKRVEKADGVLQEFNNQNGFIDFQEQYQSLVEARRKVTTRLTDLRLKRAQVAAEVTALGSYGSDGVTGAFNPAFHQTGTLDPLVAQRAKVEEELAKAMKVFKEHHPRVMELRAQVVLVEHKIREVIQGALKAHDTQLVTVEVEERALGKEKNRIEQEMGGAGRKLNEFRRLESELQAAKDIYNDYLRKEGETRASSGASLASVRVVDHAQAPVAPWKPRVMMNLALGGLVGLMLGLGVIFLMEQFDDRIQSPREVEAFLGLEVFAVIPKLSKAGSTEAPVLLDEKSSLAGFEAFRSLRAQVVTRLEKTPGCKVVAVLSPNPSEGKSTITTNLARVLAMEGRRVLIFDADLRRPSQRKLIGSAEGAGLEEVIRGEVTFDAAVQRSPLFGVDVVGAMEGTTGAAELAGTKAFEEALKLARERYDFVLIDSAPVNQVSEATLIARRADGAILVVRDGSTGRGAAHSARKRLVGMEVVLLGAVLNCAVPHARGYGYGYEYSYHYGSYGAEKTRD